MASITCQCGKVQIRFTKVSPRVNTECCCNHCFARVRCLEAMGGPKVNTEKPLLMSKWDNKVTIVKGREYLHAYKMNASTTLVTNVASSCCQTFLLGRHSVYDTYCVTTSSDFPIFSDHQQESMEPTSRWFSNQWSAEKLSKCRKLVGIWVADDGTIIGEEGFEDILKAHLAETEKTVAEDAVGETFGEVVAGIIGNEEIRVIPSPPL